MATFTNFCCRSGGSNLNAGTRTGDTTVPGTGAFKTYASGSWVAATGVFTVASGDPASDGVAVGDFASVYPDAATVTPFVGRVTARDATTITVSLTAKMGTAPVLGVSNTTLTVGGAWLGPNGASGFPWNLITSTLTNSTGNIPRINMMNDATYSITTAITNALAGPYLIQGFTAAYNDGGRFILDGGSAGASYVLFTPSGTGACAIDGIFQNNGATGSATGVSWNGNYVYRCVFHNFRGRGLFLGNHVMAIECEAYACNQSNTASIGAFDAGDRGANVFLRCIAHDNAGSNVSGFFFGNNFDAKVVECISETNGKYGFHFTSTAFHSLVNCDAYSNVSDGLFYNAASSSVSGLYVENCNFVKNGGWGINVSLADTTAFLNALVVNCGFGSGTQVNTSGTTNLPTTAFEIGSITYASGVTPWNAPTTGDFRITLPAAWAAGRGAFTETQTSYTGTIGYPDIGAVSAPKYGHGILGMAGG